ncbi:MAG: hypothetical protein Q9228_007783, partial [Teloschistes exilis]
YFACSGAVATDVTGSQIGGLKDASVDLATLTIGGNDAGLEDVLHACIYQWNENPQLDCDKALANVQATIDDPKFSSNFDDLLKALAKKMSSRDAKIYFTGRNTMNNLVDAVNQKVQDAVKRSVGQAIYVPWNARVDFIKGHFCEPGVDESKAVDREQTAFYEWSSTLDDKEDPDDHDELKRRQAPGVLQNGQNLNDMWEGQISAWVLEAI